MGGHRWGGLVLLSMRTLVLLAVVAPRAVLAQADATDTSPESVAREETPHSTMGPLLDLDIEQLFHVPVTSGASQPNLSAPSSQVNIATAESGAATTTADLLRQAPSVSARRVSAITLDPRVRGYQGSQLNGSANGISQLKSRVDIDSVFSQIDPGVVRDITIIDGPYTSLYGPGFAFIVADLLSPPRFPEMPETHLSTNFVYGSNAQTLYTRENAITGGKNWGACVSYGLRTGNDYRSGGNHSFTLPSSFQKWDGLVALEMDLDRVSRIEFDYLRTEMNDVLLPGVVYDINNSKNDQFNIRYIIQEDPRGPQQLLLQTWYTQTSYGGDSSRLSKETSLYTAFFTDPALDYDPYPVSTIGRGYLNSLGVRLLRTFGDADSAQWTVGVDWRRYEQRYDERNYAADGEIVYYNNVFGIPRSRMDDLGVLTDLMVPVNDELTINIGGRVDQAMPSLDDDDPIITVIDDPENWYYAPGYSEQSRTLGMAYITGKRKLNASTTLRAGTAFAMRSPDLTELYNDEPYAPVARFGSSYVDGLSTLKPEKNLQIDLGLTHETKRVTYGVRAFYAYIHDYIMPVPGTIDGSPPYPPIDAPHVLDRDFYAFPDAWRYDLGTPNENADTNQAGYQYVNINEAVLLGGDLSGRLRVRDGLAVFGSMSYVYGVNNSPVQFVAADSWSSPEGDVVSLGGSDGLPGIYPMNGVIGVRLSEPTEDRWCIEFLSRMVHRRTHVAATLSEIGNPGFTTFALRGYYRLRKNIRISLDLENLLNRYYTEPDSLAIIGPRGLPIFVPEPGFSALLGIEARF